MITTTLNRIRAFGPCGVNPKQTPLEGYQKLRAFLGPDHGPDDPVPFAVIVESNGLDDALWCCRAEPQYSKEWRLFAVRCARSVQHLMTDPRSLAALDVAERHANGLATDGELDAASAAARDAARDAAWAAASTAAWAAARGAARGAARAAARAAVSAARDAAWDAAWDAAMDATKADFLEVVK